MSGMFDGIFAGAGKLADNLFDILGIGAKIVLPAVTNYDPATGTETALPIETVSVKAAPPEQYSIREIDGTNILAGDVKTTIGAVALKSANVAKERLERATLVINGDSLNIVKANPVYSGNEIATYELQLRR